MSISNFVFMLPSNSSHGTSDSSDNEFETLQLAGKYRSDGKYKVNAEANAAIREISEQAHKDPYFRVSDVDFTHFGQKVLDIDFDGRQLLDDSQAELQSLMTATSESSSGYGDSASTSGVSYGSVGVPTATR